MGDQDKPRPDVTIAGSGKLAGGVYRHVTIAGSGSVDGDLQADEVKLSGAGNINPNPPMDRDGRREGSGRG